MHLVISVTYTFLNITSIFFVTSFGEIEFFKEDRDNHLSNNLIILFGLKLNLKNNKHNKEILCLIILNHLPSTKGKV